MVRIRFQTPSGAATSLPDSIITQTYVDPITLIESEITYTPASLAAAGFCDIYGNPVLNRIIGGTVAPWMTRTDGQPVVSGKFKLTCAAPECREFNFIGSSETDTNGQSVSDKKSHDLHVNVTITNGASGPYSTVQSFTYGEMWITGSGGISTHINTTARRFTFRLLSMGPARAGSTWAALSTCLGLLLSGRA